jgi:hypothetical protein
MGVVHRDYLSRLRIPVDGSDGMVLYTRTRVVFSTGFKRVVIGGRGPYIEFSRGQILFATREASELHYFFRELRSVPDDLKIYYQKHKVDYADYVPGLLYASPFDLYLDDGACSVERRDERQGRLFP